MLVNVSETKACLFEKTKSESTNQQLQLSKFFVLILAKTFTWYSRFEQVTTTERSEGVRMKSRILPGNV